MANFLKVGKRIFNTDAIAVIYKRVWGDHKDFPYAVTMIGDGDEEGYKLTQEEAELLIRKVME
jgi:hypothetical protein